MNNTLNMVLRTTLTAAGAAVAGSAGGILGGFVAGLLATAIPGAADVIGNVVTQITNESLASASQGIIKRLEPSEKHLLNKDLQMAFRQAMVEGLYDIGGPLCFQKAWKSAGRDVNETIVLPLLRKENQAKESQSTLYQQTCQCLQDLEKEMSEGVLLPLEPPSNQPGAQVQSFLGAELPQELDRIFFDQVIAPWLKKYRALAQELPELPYYLRTNLLDRTLVHLDDILLNNAPAWNAFNRLMMEQMQSNLRDVGEQQSELFKKLEMMVDRKDETALVEWSASAATLISATGRLEKKQDENFSQLMQRTAEQHSEVMQHLQTILAVNERIEKKVERVLRYLENGQWIIEGARPDAAFQVPYPGEPPFMGMEYFDTQDASLFFGRQELITRLTTRIQKQSFLAVIGSSGSGKSSLVRAGVVPSLLGKRWKIHIFTPTDHPLLALASTLTRDGSLNATRELTRELEEDPQTLSLASRKLIDTASTGILFVIDQFEELFTLCQNEIEKSCFINNLVEAVGEAKSPIKVLLTLRADFYGACAEYAPLRQLLSTNQEFIGAMSTQELRQAIEEPARLNGWSFEPGLVELILRDAGQEPGTLPLLSHALLETWKHRRGKTMLLESYAEAGGVQGAIAHTADRVYQHGLDLSEQEIARNIFLRLTTLGEGTQDTRRRADLGELISSPDQKKKVESVIRSLADARLITIQENTVEVAHEALIREWPALRQWLEENRESLRTQRRIEDAAKEWVRLGKDQAQLIKGKKLAEAKEWADSSPLQISNLENEYLVASLEAAEKEMAEEASRKQREVEKSRQLVDVLRLRVEEQAEHTKRLKRRAYMLTAALAIAAVLAAAAGIFASLSNKNAAEANRQTLRARAGELSAQAKLMQEQFPQRAALLAMEAVNLDVRASQPPDPLALTVLWQTATQRRSTLLPGIQAELLDAAYHPQGRWIAAVDTIGNLYFWDGSDPSKDPVIMNRGDLFLFSIFFSPDGKWLAGASTNKIVLWDMENLEEQPAEILPPEPGVTTIAFNPDSTLFSSGTINGNIYTWKTSDLQRYPQRLATECGRTYALNFNPGGDMLAVGCAGLKDQKNPVLLYSLKSTQTNPIVFSGHTNTISQIAFSKDGQWLVSGSSDRTARVWKLTNPEELPVILDGFKGDVFDVVISPDQKHLAVSSGDFSIHIWELNNLANPPEILHGHENWVSGISYSPDSKKLLSASWDKQIRIWDLEHTLGLPVEVRGTSMGVYAPTFSTDGKWLASGSLDGKLQLWDTTNTDSQPKSMQLHQGRFYTLMFHPNGRWLISTGQDKKLQIFDVETKQVVQSVQLDEEITAITLRRDGKQLAGVGSKNVIHLWQVDDLSIPAIDLPRPDSTTYALAYSPDGQKLVSSHEDFSIRIHTLQKLSAEPKTLKGPRGATLAMTFNPTGTILATTGVDRMIRLWDITQDEPTSSILTGHERPLSALAFSPDGTLLASGGGDHTIRVWRVEAGSSASPIVLPMNGDFATLLTFSADGKRLASGAWNGSLTLWPMEVKQLQEYACQFTGRNLTDLEWQQFLPDEKMRSTCSQWVTTSP